MDALGGSDCAVRARRVGRPFDVASGYDLFNEARRLVAELAAMRLAAAAVHRSPATPSLSSKATAPTRHMRCCGVWAARWRWNIPKSGAASSMSTSRCPPCWPPATAGRSARRRRRGPGRVPGRCTPRAAAAKANPARIEPPVELGTDTSQLVIGATGNIGPHLIRQLADMGAGTIVAVSRNPGSRLDELARKAWRRAGRPGRGGGRRDRRNRDEPRCSTGSAPICRRSSGIYLAAFAGGPVTLSDMTDDDVTAMFRPKLDAVALLHTLSLRHPVRQFVLFSSISG